MLVLKQNRPINGINKKEDTMTKDHMYVGCFIIWKCTSCQLMRPHTISYLDLLTLHSQYKKVM